MPKSAGNTKESSKNNIASIEKKPIKSTLVYTEKDRHGA